MKMSFTPTLVPILGLVIGMLLVFRTNTAYDRYYEGRNIWSKMTHSIRILTRLFWLGKGNPKNLSPDPSEDLIEKATAIKLLVAFAYATKNYLREEYSYTEDEDMKELIGHIPRFTRTFFDRPNNARPGNNTPSNEIKIKSKDNLTRKVTMDVPEVTEATGGKKAVQRPRTMSTRRKSALAIRDSEVASFTRRDSMYMAHDYVKPTNIPLELIYYIDSYCASRAIEFGATHVNNLTEFLTQFERILRTPMPLAYSVHLHHSLWLYLLALPYQLVETLGWVTVPIIGLVTFALVGILAIGWEIENPFGYDDNDLPLDDFCEVIREEAKMIMGHQVGTPESWTFCKENRPFAPRSYESAVDLKGTSVEGLLEILGKGDGDYTFWNLTFQSEKQ